MPPRADIPRSQPLAARRQARRTAGSRSFSSTPYTLAAHTQDKWFRPTVETGVTEPRWVRAIEVKPVRRAAIARSCITCSPTCCKTSRRSPASRARRTTHQSNAGLFMEWAVGKTGQVFAADAGKLMLPGSRIRWEVHMHAIGEEYKDSQVELAIYFYPKGFVPKHRTVLHDVQRGRGSELDIPPNEKTMTQNFYVHAGAGAHGEFPAAHAHARQRRCRSRRSIPDGRKEVLSAVNNFQWNWHVNYIYADDAAPLLPKGTVLVFTAWHDNTAANTNNPDPNQWVGWGDRTVDEMAHAWIDVTYLEQAEFDSLVAARKAKVAAEKATGQR